jgi:hypothetical protein
MHLKNTSNGYISALVTVGLFDRIPKTVFAAIAVSGMITRGDADGTELDPDGAAAICNAILAEWWALYHNGIVSQRPPGSDPHK